MKINYSLIIFYMPMLFITNSCKSSEPEEKKVYYKIINDNSQNIYVQKTKTEACCDERINSDLVECIFSLPVDDQREFFTQLSPARKRECLRNFSPQQYEKFLEAYSEYDWKKLYNTLSETEKAHWPKTVKEQLIALEWFKYTAENDNKNVNLAMAGVGIFISPIPYLAYYGYAAYKWLEDGTRIIVDRNLKCYVKAYIESTFEI